MNAIYLDFAATSPLLPEVLENMMPYLTDIYGNPSSLHGFGRAARRAVLAARDAIAEQLGCEGKELIFTSGGTESDNLALFGVAQVPLPMNGKRHIVTSQIEHHAVLHSCRRLEQLGYEVTYLPVDTTGLIRMEDVEAALRPDTLLVSVMYGNNEVGTVQPIAEIGRLARERGIVFHVDAVQALGVLPIDLAALPVDLMSFSAHKIGGPKGVGALYCSSRTKLCPLMFGGSQERKRRAGTENVAGIVGFAEALRISLQNLAEKQQKLEKLRLSMIEALRGELGDGGFLINGHPEKRLPHVLNVSFPGLSSETLLMNFDLAGIAASSGSACASGSLELSHVLQAMGLPEERAASAVRFSFGPRQAAEEILAAAKHIGTIVRRLRSK